MIEFVGCDVDAAIAKLTTDQPQAEPPQPSFWQGAHVASDPRAGYLQELDADGVADWAAERGTAVRMLVRPGGYVFPGAPIALATSRVDGVEAAIRSATALVPQRVSSVDVEFAMRQLVEVAVRALSRHQRSQ